MRVGAGRGLRTWCREQEVQQAREARRRRRGGVYGDPDDPYLSTFGVKKEFGWDKRTLLGWESSCPYLPSGQLRPKLFRRRHGPLKERRTYRKADLEAIRQAHQALRQEPQHSTDAPSPVVELSIAAGAKMVGVHARTLRAFLTNCPYLPGGYLPHELRKPPGHRGHPSPVVRLDDLLQLKAKIHEALTEESQNSKLKSSAQLESIHHVRGAGEVKRLRRCLKKWRVAGVLPAKRVRRKKKSKRGRVSLLWLYDGDTFRRLWTAEEGASLPVEPEISGEAAATPPPGRGRRRSKETAELYEWCYHAYARVVRGEWKMLRALKEAVSLFKAKAPKEESHLRLFARRHAERADPPLPFPPPRE
jgi:hypothetical protein